MSRLVMGTLAACAILWLTGPAFSAATPATPKLAVKLTGPCAALEGHRWIAYVEPFDQHYISAEYWEFRYGLINGPGVNGLVGRPYPREIKGTMDSGRSAVTKFTACVNDHGRARLWADWAPEPIYDVTLSADGLTATVAGTNTRVDTTDLRGWAARAPN